MNPHFFVFNGIDSRAMGVHVVKYPPIMRAAERVKYVALPGRAGDLTQKEGEAVFDAYNRGIEISNAKGFSLDRVRKWLRGRGTMIVGNEPQYMYQVDLGAQCQFDRVIRGIWGGNLIMHTQPFKQLRTPTAPITVTSSGTVITNPGDVPASPLVTLTCSTAGSATLTIGGKTLTLSDAATGCQVDCDLNWYLNALGAPQWNKASGQFGKLPKGDSAVSFSGVITQVEIAPRWCYL